MSVVWRRAIRPNQALHRDRGCILVSRDTTPLQRPRRVNSFVELNRCAVERMTVSGVWRLLVLITSWFSRIPLIS